ncbi:phosphodiester glycosidase family protein [Paenibacillus thermotolerans]|uniref:phosphodiester glycosidase family protein n=1 Tax=Paenibacillus thermotolerans TaxID=3027807 RepID=UPI0023675146|nr:MULTISPECIES: phosphodiester glycosidase family protein [unclassified Paenibacillus]
MKRHRWLHRLKLSLMMAAIIILLGAAWLTYTPSGHRLKLLAVDTLISTQHREWAKYLIGENALQRRLEQYENRFDAMAQEKLRPVVVDAEPKSETKSDAEEPLYRIEPISGEGWEGHLLIVPDPKSIRIGIPNRTGRGETVSSMLLRLGAEAGVNGGAFSDPNWSGNGFKPKGIVITNGETYYNDSKPGEKIDIIGFTFEGSMIAGQYTAAEIAGLGLKEAVSFRPRLIVNGKGLVKNDEDGWGIAPRTAIAQTGDGTVLFAVIDGRQTHSIGATLYDVQELFLERGAVVAANLDGGASTVLVTRSADDEAGYTVVNKPASKQGERYLPTAFLVFKHPDGVTIGNIWEGLDMEHFDPAKW